MVIAILDNSQNGAMDRSLRSGQEASGDEVEMDSGEKYDSYGAMDLSSSCSGSVLGEEDKEEGNRKDKEEGNRKGKEEGTRKRKAEDALDYSIREEDASGKSLLEHALNRRNKRKNIKDILDENLLKGETKAAQEEEVLRLKRIKRNQKELSKAVRRRFETGNIISLDSEEEEEEEEEEEDKNKSSEDERTKGPDVVTVPGSDSDECLVISEAEEEEEEEDNDTQNSGMHINDALNVRDPDGSVLVNLGHPTCDADIRLAPQIAECVKPHQIGGLRFLYENIIESSSIYENTPGFGCILAHNMGLGKTMQIVSFVDIFLGVTGARKVLCIVPINTIQNWLAEFNYWLPAQGEYSKISERCKEMKHRTFQIHVLNDSLKNLGQRAAVIRAWDQMGGVLVMGYELYRQLANRRQRRRRGKRGPECIDLEEEDRNKHILTEIQCALVNPGPDLVVCDEGHRIKNSHASISQALKQIRTRRRIVLTGYPLQNNLMEYWCMVDFVRPNFLGNKTEFTNMFERPIQNGQCIDSTPRDVMLMKNRAYVLHDQLKGFVQRRGHIVLKDSLPAKKEHVLFIRLTPVQRKLYSRFMEELIADRCVSNPLKAFAVCCKIWNHPDVLYNFIKKKEDIDIDFDPEEVFELGSKEPGDGKKEEINYDWAQGMLNGYVTEDETLSNKLQIFLGILEESVMCGDRLLLFSQSLCTLNIIETFLQKRTVPNSQDRWRLGVSYYRLDGSTSALERERLINAFNSDPRVKLFLVSTRAGSLGVNLVGANRVIIFDASWNPCHDTQAVCRVYRYGQVKETHVYRLVTDNSLEKKIYDRQINKQGMSDRIVDKMNPDAHLSSKEVHSLICEEEEDPEPVDMKVSPSDYEDPVMKVILKQFGKMLTKAPFSHESLLVDRQETKLSKAERRLAKRAYLLEKKSQITYSRPSYAAFYPKHGSFATNLHNPGSNGFTRNRYYEYGKKLDSWGSGTSSGSSYRPVGSGGTSYRPVASVQPLQATNGYTPGSGLIVPPPRLLPGLGSGAVGVSDSILIDSFFPTPSFSNVMTSAPAKRTPSSDRTSVGRGSSSSRVSVVEETKSVPPGNQPPKVSSSTNSVLEALNKQGVGIQHLVVPRDLVIPTNPREAPISLKAGQSVMVIQTPKGIYLRLDEKIIKIKQQVAVSSLFGNIPSDLELSR